MPVNTLGAVIGIGLFVAMAGVCCIAAWFTPSYEDRVHEEVD